jgi:GTPase
MVSYPPAGGREFDPPLRNNRKAKPRFGFSIFLNSCGFNWKRLITSFFLRLKLASLSIYMKSGFVNIFGRPNAGKSTLLNALMGEKLAIVSRKVQTTRHRIKGILSEKDYQVIFSDTPGIIEPKYKLHEKMMQAVKSALEDADVALLIVDVNENLEECNAIFEALKLKVPAVVVINKIDRASQEKIKEVVDFFSSKEYCKKVVTISALSGINKKQFMKPILELLPEGVPFYTGDDISDLPTKFFAGEMIREKVYELFEEEIPYQTAVVIREFKEKSTLVKITADIVVQRETQKAILLGEKGNMIKKLGTEARQEIEKFIGQKVFLELFVKVKPGWRENELQLREYGY